MEMTIFENPLVVAQHTKTMATDHGLNRDGDAIVMQPGASETASRRILSGGCRVAAHVIGAKCPIALSVTQWVALDRPNQQGWKTIFGDRS
jgi:succinyl-CoA synthetase beta subunit